MMEDFDATIFLPTNSECYLKARKYSKLLFYETETTPEEWVAVAKGALDVNQDHHTNIFLSLFF